MLRICAAVFGSMLVSASTANAHEQAIAFTQLSFLSDASEEGCFADGCRIEVAHRLVIHDAESTLMDVLGVRADLVSDPQAQSRFETYVAERFELLAPDTGQPIPLTLLGGEVERGYYWVYQEGELAPGMASVLVSQTVLMDAIPRQTNRVNIRYSGRTQTLVFEAGSRPNPYHFGEDPA